MSLTSNRLPPSQYMNPMLSQFRKRVQLKRPVQPVMPVNKTIPPTNVNTNSNKKKKSVRFHQDEQVRYFLKCQSPSAIRGGDPPLDAVSANDFDLKLPNWPKRRSIYLNDGKSKIRMESLVLTEADNLKENKILLEGRCRALNISYEKLVSIRYTFDLWSTFHETTAIYRDSVPIYGGQAWDRFSFYIPVTPSKKNLTVYIALKYSVGNDEYWDNNDGMNYQAIVSPKYDVPFESDSEEEEDEMEIVKTFNELDLNNTTNADSQQVSMKVLGRRYDFTASLNAVRKPFTSSPPLSPPCTPTDSEPMSYTPPVFFSGASSYISNYSTVDQPLSPPYSPFDTSMPSTPTTPTSPTTPVSVPMQKEQIQVVSSTMDDPLLKSSPFSSTEGYNNQMSYSDFVNKYCFYNSHSNPLYNNNVYSTSPSTVLS